MFPFWNNFPKYIIQSIVNSALHKSEQEIFGKMDNKDGPSL